MGSLLSLIAAPCRVLGVRRKAAEETVTPDFIATRQARGLPRSTVVTSLMGYGSGP
jgi:hypothetical protein